MEPPQLDREAATAEIARRHGILIGRDDPAWALVTMNELALREVITQVETRHAATIERVRSMLADFEESIGAAETRAGEYLAQDIRAISSELRDAVARPPAPRELPSPLSALDFDEGSKWAVAVVLSFIAGLLASHVL